jgi:hypothetical protein
MTQLRDVQQTLARFEDSRTSRSVKETRGNLLTMRQRDLHLGRHNCRFEGYGSLQPRGMVPGHATGRPCHVPASFLRMAKNNLRPTATPRDVLV